MKLRTLCITIVSCALAATAGVWAAAPAAHAPDPHAPTAHEPDAHKADAPKADDHAAPAATPKADAHAAPAPAAAASSDEISPDDALKQLIEGNERYTSSLLTHPHGDAARRCDTFSNGQHPIAAILSCADSRAPVELLFDQGIGDVFVIRVAGNVADVDEIGTIEYGAEHLHIPLIVVLGHTKCGAVTAVANGAKVSKNIAQLVDNIAPAVDRARKLVPGAKGDTLIQAATDANVFQSIQDLLTNSEDVRHLVAAGKVKVVGAVYDIHIGGVRWLGEHPGQAGLLKGESTAAAPHGELLHAAPAAAHDTHEAKAPADTHAAPHGPSSSAEKNTKPMPHETGTLKGMLIPASFLGGAGIASGAIIHFMKSRGNTPEAVPEPAKADA